MKIEKKLTIIGWIILLCYWIACRLKLDPVILIMLLILGIFLFTVSLFLRRFNITFYIARRKK